MDFADVRRLVLSIDEEKVTEQMVEQLIKYLPNRDEMLQLTAYKDKINDLSDAERFGVIVSSSVWCDNKLDEAIYNYRACDIDIGCTNTWYLTVSPHVLLPSVYIIDFDGSPS